MRMEDDPSVTSELNVIGLAETSVIGDFFECIIIIVLCLLFLT